MGSRVEKLITLDAPRSRVWRALTEVEQFNAWFGVSLATPFAPGAEVSGQIKARDYEHVTMTIWIETMEPDRFFSFRWHPYASIPGSIIQRAARRVYLAWLARCADFTSTPMT